jgi:raffinose/stachyose/melibiose transport system permease protein
MTTTTTREPTDRTSVDSPAPSRRRVELTYLLMLLPAVGLFTAFVTLPALAGMFYSLTDYVGFGEWEFIGLRNYLVLFTDPRILDSYAFTIFFAVVTTVVVNVVALALALGLSSRIKWRTGLRAVFFLPMVVSGIVIAYVFNFIFSNELPRLASTVGFGPLETSMLANQDLAWVAIVIVTAWQSVPGAMIIYLAGLLAIPDDVYEAGSLDGATAWGKFRHITLPLVAGYVVINTILGMKNYLNAYDIIVGLTNGGPGTSTMSVAMTIFTGFTGGDYAYQMANAVVFFVVTVLISLVQLRIINRRGVTL